MYCPEIHHNISIHYLNNTATHGPCCISIHKPIIDEKIVNSDYLTFLREENKKGRLTDTCQACINSEKYGDSSRRIRQLEFYKDWKDGIRGIDIHLGNLCNLKCVTCGASDSTSWHQDWIKLGKEIDEDWKYDKGNQYDISWLSNFSKLEMVHFWGGEPLMGDAHVKFLKELKEKNILKNCRIQYNTNGTHRVSEEVLSLWSEAHLVELYFSIDDIDERFNYIRTGADWDEVKSNLAWFKENLPSNHLLYVNVVWSYLNVYYLPELYNWFNENFNETLSGDPIKVNRQHAFGVCHVDTLTQEQYKHLEEKLSDPKFKPILKEIKIGSDISLKFKEYINKLDTIRNMNYRKTFPEWGALLGV